MSNFDDDTWRSLQRQDFLGGKYGFPVTRTLVLTVAILLSLRVVLAPLGTPWAPILAIAGTVVFIAGWLILRKRRYQKTLMKGHSLRKRLGALEKQETSLRIEEARREGKFDKWEADT